MKLINTSAFITTDLGYGDSGKGSTVDYLCRTIPGNKIVIRLQGGHQIGHTVSTGEVLHEFHNFGSGTLQGVPTYYGPETTCFPGHRYEVEFGKLIKIIPNLPEQIYHPDVMITTIFDVLYNRWQEDCRGDNRHGSVGLGFNATISRNEKLPFVVSQCEDELIVKGKLTAIKNYYLSLGVPSNVFYNVDLDEEIEYILSFRENIRISYFEITLQLQAGSVSSISLIFEANQGLLLDQKYGDFPHVTRSDCTCGKPLELLKHLYDNRLIDINIINFYDMARIYHTRHGAGPFEVYPIELINDECESNHTNDYQKEFKKSILQISLLRYACECNAWTRKKFDYFTRYFPINTKLIFTCVDQVKNIRYVDTDGIVYDSNIDHITDLLPMYDDYKYSDNPKMNLKDVE